MTPEVIAGYDRAVPRYTSYPTAPHFTPEVDAACYRRWLADLAAGGTLSLYLHVPFCDRLCWFCGCQTTVVNRYAPVAAYVATLKREVDLVAAALGAGQTVTHLHWGGGTPTMLRPDDVGELADHLRRRFVVADDAEFAVEIDPRTLARDDVAALAAAGVTRASLGVQDFDPAVQRAVNRLQPFETTERVVDWLREAGIEALNIDLMYGLPLQTAGGLTDTVAQVLVLRPDRVTLFGYAHVPWMKRHQKLIDEAQLPDARERAEQAEGAAARLVDAGYVAVGLDHFALPGDGLAVAAREGRLRRNFQGYTSDRAATLLGLGASAIGTLTEGYVQNAAETPAWRKTIEGGEFAIERGIAIDDEDRLRRAVIERLMCDFVVDLDAVCRAHGTTTDALTAEIAALDPLVADGLARIDGHKVSVPPDARLLVRVVCAAFDSYFKPIQDRHARAV